MQQQLKRILVTGATGKQGGALIKALTSTPNPTFELIALTRDTSTASAQRLANLPNVSLLQGNLDDTQSIFTALKTKTAPLYGVFSVQTPLHPAKEQAQGISLAETAASHGVKHFIYTSADRGGSPKSDSTPTPIPHFISKHNIELRIKQLASSTAMRYTIIRPVAFMDNMTPDFFGRVFGTALKFHGPRRKMQLVDTQSVGILAAEAFKDPEKFMGRSVSFATDSVSFEEANAAFQRKFGRELPKTYDFVGKIVMWAAWKELGIMFKWIREEGFGADVNEFKYPGMQNFEQWLEKTSKFAK